MWVLSAPQVLTHDSAGSYLRMGELVVSGVGGDWAGPRVGGALGPPPWLGPGLCQDRVSRRLEPPRGRAVPGPQPSRPGRWHCTRKQERGGKGERGGARRAFT
jgi:hypothetical protein